MKQNGTACYQIRLNIGGLQGQNKTSKGGWDYVGVKPKTVYVWDQDLLGGEVNVFKDIEFYLECVAHTRKPEDRFFGSVNYYKFDMEENEEWFLKINLGHNSYVSYMLEACNSLNIIGLGDRDSMKRYGLRATVITQLFDCGNSDTTVLLLSDHRCLKGMKNIKISTEFSVSDYKSIFIALKINIQKN